ncbi:MAG: hypothetical protein AAFV07_05095 [Bacteroidota bacterium]
MRPLLHIGPLTSLQDARSSAAVGFDVISFSLERGSPRKLSGSLIWNMINWLSGPEIFLEWNAPSLPEVQGLADTVVYQGLIAPWADVGELASASDKPQWWRIPASGISEAPDNVLLYVEVNSAAEALALEPHFARLILHFPDLEASFDFLNQTTSWPYALSLGPEAEEEMGVLDYERIDEWLEKFQEHFPDFPDE